jgi:cytochrome b561
MKLRNTPSGYGLVTKAFHWIIFMTISIQPLVGYMITRIDDDFYESITGGGSV